MLRLGHEKPRRAAGVSLVFFLLLFYRMEHNYYANYFSEVSGLFGVVYWDFGASRGLTCDFTGKFEEKFFGGGREGVEIDPLIA